MMEKEECKVCGYVWESRVEEPKQCPKCKRYDFKKGVEDERRNN